MASPSGVDSDEFPLLHNIFENGLPSVGSLEHVISNMDYQIDINSRELDECLQAVLTFTNELPGNKCLSSPQDTLKYMINCHVLEKSSCYDLDMDDIIRILQHVQTSLENHPGCEELILEDLMTLSSSEGISLPLRSSATPRAEDSVASLNSVQDNHEVLIEQLWDQIALKFRRYFTDKLSKLPLRGFEQELNLQEQNRIEYLQSLVMLYQPDDIWFCYQMLRVQQLETYFNSLLPQSGEDEKLDIAAITKNCSMLAALITGMIDEDFAILTTGIFKKASSTFKAIHDLYLDKYADEMSALIEEIYDDLKDIIHRNSAQSSSEFLFDANHKKPLLKGYSSTAEQGLLSAGGRRGSHSRKASIVISRHYLQSLRDILLSVFHIDEHIDYLYKMATTSGSSTISNKRRGSKGSLRGVLKSVSPEVLRRKGSNSSEGSTSESSSMRSQSPLLDCRPAPKVIEKTKVEEKPMWEWKLIFKLIVADLVQCVEQIVWTSASAALEKEQKDWEIAHTLDVFELPKEMVSGRLDYPRVISKCVHEVMEDLDMLLPFAKAGNDGILHPVKTAFVHSANQLFSNIHGHYLSISQDIPKKAAAKLLLVVLSSTVYIRNHLCIYDEVLAEEDGTRRAPGKTTNADRNKKKSFLNRYQQFMELTDILTHQVTQVHNNLLSNILYDAESYHWAEEKEFYENERCSFPIQMWHQHLNGLRTDLWSICPPKLAQNIFTQVLYESLAILTRRYTRIKPSFRRVVQFRMDITTILLCMFDQMMYVCDSSSKLLEPGYHQQPYYDIHNMCSILLSTLAVLTSPVDLLYRACKKMHQTQQENSFSRNSLLVDDNRSYNSHWISWVQPGLLQPEQKNYGDLLTTVALYIHTKLLVSQPEPLWPLVVQAVVMKNYTLPILFMTQSLSQGDRVCVQRLDRRSSVAPTEKEILLKRLFNSICTVLLHMSLHFPDGLGRVILPVIDRYNQWNMIEQLGACNYSNPMIPIWLETIFNMLKPFTLRVLKPVLKKLLNHPNNTREIESVMSVISDLPCGCVPQSIAAFRTKRQQGCARDQVESSVLELIRQVSEHVYTLPTSLCSMFRILQDAAKEKSIQFAHDCLGLQVIALCLKTQLWAGMSVEKMAGTSFSPETKDTLSILAESIYTTLVHSEIELGTIEVGNLLQTKHNDWINKKIRSIVTFFNSESCFPPPRHLPENTIPDFAEQFYISTCNEVVEGPLGQECLSDIFWLIVHNMSWLETQLDIQTTLPRNEEKAHPSFNINFLPVAPPSFNPLATFDEIGNAKLDAEKINKFDCNWNDLLFRDLGLSIYGLRTLLMNRHDMQEGAFLEEHERKPVDGLRLLLDYDTNDLR